MNCSSSNVSIIEIECQFKSTSRMNQTVSFGGKIIKNLTNPQVMIEWSYKTGNNLWRDLLKFEKVPVCQFLNRAIKLPYLENVIEYYQSILSTFPHSCPILAGSYYMRNISNGQYDGFKDMIMRNFGGMQNGFYKGVLKMHSVKDDNIFTAIWQAEIDSIANGAV